MAGAFDPYYRWLSIPAKEQPPTHYRLLGLELLEADPDVIEGAADRQMAHVRLHQSGPHAEAAQRLLNEIAAAKLCLLDRNRKSAYDAQLQSTVAQPAKPAPLRVAEPLVASPAAKPAAPIVESTTATGNHNMFLLLAAMGAAGGICLLLGLVALFVVWPSGEQVVAEYRPPEVTSAEPMDRDVPATPQRADVNSPANEIEDRPTIVKPSPPPNIAPSPANIDTDDEEGNDTSHPATDVATPKVQPPPVDTTREEVAAIEPGDDKETSPTPKTVADDKPAQPADDRLAIPDAATRQKRQAQIRELFPVDDARTAIQKRELARRLLETGVGTTSDTDARFVLFNLARELASESGDMETAFASVEKLNEQFQIEPDAVRLASFDAAAKSALPAATRKGVVVSGVEYVDELLARDKYVEAAQLIADLQIAVRSLRDRELGIALAERRKTGSQLFTQYQQVEAAFADLQEDSDDAAANLVAGRFYCFAKGDWQRGLPLLAKGSDEQLKQLAEREMAAPATGDDRLALAAAWWKLADAGEGHFADGQRARAAMWYKTALRDLSGLSKIQAQKRIDEAAGLTVNGGGPFSTHLARVDRPADKPADPLPPDPADPRDPDPVRDPEPAPEPVELIAGKDLPKGGVLRLGSRRFMHPANIQDLWTTSDGKSVVSLGGGKIRKWNLRDGQSVAEGAFDLASFSRADFDGDRLMLIAEPLQNGVKGQDFRIVDLNTGKETLKFHHDGWSHSSTISPGGRLVAIGNIDLTVTLIDGESGKVLSSLDFKDGDHNSRPGVWFSRSGSTLVVRKGNRVRFYDIVMRSDLGEEVAVFESKGAIALSPKGDVAAMVENGSTSLWNARTGEQTGVLVHPAKYSLSGPVFSPDGKFLAMFLLDHRILIWDVAGGRLAKEIPTGTTRIGKLDFTPDGGKLVGNYGGRMFVWDVATGKEETHDPRHDLDGPAFAVAVSPDGRWIASADRQGYVTLWSHADRWAAEPLPVAAGGRYDPQPQAAFLQFIASGKRLVAGSCNRRNAINMWDVATRSEAGHIRGHAWPVVSVAVNEQAGLIASTSRDKTLRIWSDKGAELHKLEIGGGCVEFSPDGKLVAMAAFNTTPREDQKAIQLIDTATGAVAKRLEGHTESTLDVSFSPDGKNLVSSANDKTLRIWNIDTGELNREIPLADEAGRGARQVAYSPDGKHIAATAADGKVYLYDAETGKQQAALSGHDGAIQSLAWRSDSGQLITGGSDASIMVWDVAEALR